MQIILFEEDEVNRLPLKLSPPQSENAQIVLASEVLTRFRKFFEYTTVWRWLWIFFVVQVKVNRSNIQIQMKLLIELFETL